MKEYCYGQVEKLKADLEAQIEATNDQLVVGTVCGPKRKGSFDYYSFSDFMTHFYESTESNFKKVKKKTEDKLNTEIAGVQKKARDHAEYLSQKMNGTLADEIQKV